MPRSRRRREERSGAGTGVVQAPADSSVPVSSDLVVTTMSLKADNFLRPFTGKDDSWELFYNKFLVLSNVQGWDNEEKRMKNLPLFLDKDAFLVFSKMPTADQVKENKVKEKMVSSFSMTPAQGYQSFVRRRMKADESPDAYVADLERLLAISGHSSGGDAGKDPVLIEQLLTGLPGNFAKEIRLSLAGQELTVSACLQRVHALRNAESDSRPRQGVVGAAPQLQRLPNSAGGASSRSSSKSVVCFRCNSVGHVRKDCPQRHVAHGKSYSASARPIVCNFCEEEGHILRDCPMKKRWLESQRKPVAAVVEADSDVESSPVDKPERALCAPVAQPTELPKIYVDIQASSSPWTRDAAVIDTGASRTLVSAAFLHNAKMDFSPECTASPVALDGQALDILGSLELTLKREDGPVYLPPVSVVASVVVSLDVVNVPILIGSDVVAACGGLQLQYADGLLSSVCFGAKDAGSVQPPPDGPTVPDSHPYRHVTVRVDGDDVTLECPDGSVRWDASRGQWYLSWKWSSGAPPTSPVGPPVGEYSRTQLTAEQEELFCAEVDQWLAKGWMEKYDEAVHGDIAGVLPLLAVAQEHKESTPVRPCLDYRRLNNLILSQPGQNSPSCQETLRKWRVASDESSVLLDIRKAYLQIHVEPELVRYQTVAWQGQLYVMTRMGFGLAIAPKFMDIIVQWILRHRSNVDNYIDDLLTPKSIAEDVASDLRRYGLDTKPAEPLPAARVLGLQLSSSPSGGMQWSRRAGVDLSVPRLLTKRAVFRWCGRITGHYPVCSWLRPACSALKRLASVTENWDAPVSSTVEACCVELAERLQVEDPVHGVWQVSCSPDSQWTVWCDASDVALGVVLEVDGQVIEDASWLRPQSDHKHINVAELDAVVKGLNLARDWGATRIQVATDSKTVAAWLEQLVHDLQRVKSGGLNATLIRRRLEIIEDLLATTNLHVQVLWVPSEKNLADRLSRIPSSWVKRFKQTKPVDIAAGAVPQRTPPVLGPVTMERIVEAQGSCPVLSTIVAEIQADVAVSNPSFRQVRDQLIVEDGVLYRSVKLPVEGLVVVPVVPETLEPVLLGVVHDVSGHGSSTVMHDMLRSRCFFSSMSEKCRQFCRECPKCCAASHRAGAGVPSTRRDIPGRPWSVVYLDTLELGLEKSGRYHSVLVCIDDFSKWAEVVPLKRHDAQSVAKAFVSVCCRWGPPDVIRVDNGTEFQNSIVDALWRQFHIQVKTGATRHPQSQGTVERMNRTLLTMIRKVLGEADDWLSALDLLLYYYRNRPHSTTKLSPMMVMTAWQSRDLIVDKDQYACELSQWVSQLGDRAARVRDIVEMALSDHDAVQEECPLPLYQPDEEVMLRRPERRQKLLTPYEPGWVVKKVLSPSTVVIVSGAREKVVNVELIKPAPQPAIPPTCRELRDDEPHDGQYGLRDRQHLVPPARFCD